MAVAFRSAASTAINASSVTVSRPSGTSDGDVLVGAVTSTNVAITPPSGWVEVSRTEVSTGIWLTSFVKVADASEPTDYTFDRAFASATITAIVAAYTGVDPTDPVNSVAGAGDPSTSSTVIPAPSVTTDAADCVVACFHAINASSTISTPDGTTVRHERELSSRSMQLSDFLQPSAGATSAKPATAGTAGANAGQQIALAPANTPPLASTGLSPTGTIDRTATRRFSWTFADSDSGDTQSAFDLEVREQGETLLDVDVAVEAPNSYYDLAGGTLAAGLYEWRVRTYDAQGAQGAWSSWTGFSAIDPPAGPTITAPTAGSTVSVEDFEVAWSASQQDAYQLRRVADVAGSPDTGTVYFDTGIIASSGARSRSVTFETNNRDEHVQLRVQRGGLWSPWASVDFDVSYTVPEVPAVSVAVLQESYGGLLLDAGLRVTASHPTPGAGVPAVTYVDVWRRETGDTGDGIRVAAEWAASSPFDDLSVASGVDYEFRVRAFGDNGTSVYSGWTASLSEPEEPVDPGESTLPATLPFVLA